jgi:hypothetical protein
MAHGLPCKHCGWQETYHTGKVNIADETNEDPAKIKRGYRTSFNKCPGFGYSEKNLRKARKGQESFPTTHGILNTIRGQAFNAELD